ncbi:MAG: ribonuclease HII [Acidobacteria bacterium]|nr:ribonuclease HII [Acidobacteriota bacterium]MCB9377214.1 ribonuclease HII [Holophagales bacterium]
MRSLEETLALAGYDRVAGVDEAGRGCLAGPVVAAAVIPHPSHPLPGIDDSKKVAPEARERLAEAIRETALAWAVVEVAAEVIDRTDILRATRQAMVEAVEGLRPAPDVVVTDAVALRDVSLPCLPVVKGDAWSFAVACASILAKVARDRKMVELDRRFPHYGFARHKGYGAPEHRDALERFGPSPIHRLTFASVVPRVETGAPA